MRETQTEFADSSFGLTQPQELQAFEWVNQWMADLCLSSCSLLFKQIFFKLHNKRSSVHPRNDQQSEKTVEWGTYLKHFI